MKLGRTSESSGWNPASRLGGPEPAFLIEEVFLCFFQSVLASCGMSFNCKFCGSSSCAQQSSLSYSLTLLLQYVSIRVGHYQVTLDFEGNIT
jgi:hypothetical protein